MRNRGGRWWSVTVSLRVVVIAVKGVVRGLPLRHLAAANATRRVVPQRGLTENGVVLLALFGVVRVVTQLFSCVQVVGGHDNTIDGCYCRLF